MSKNIQQQCFIPSELHGQRFDAVAAQLFSEFSRSQLSQWIKLGQLTIDGQTKKPKDKTAAGSLLNLDATIYNLDTPFNESMAEAIPLQIVYEDEDLIVINKPAGLVVHPGAGNPQHTLVNALLFHCPTLQHIPRAGIVHRLDKDTTGLLLIAKTLESHTSLIRQMQAREIHRNYQALVKGSLISSGTVDTNFGRHPRNRLKMSVLREGRQAITHYTIAKKYHGLSLLDVSLETGRTHQIRVHLAYLGHPVVGDPLYGNKIPHLSQYSEPLNLALVALKRQALHAAEISLLHPRTKEELTFTAPLPDDFEYLLNLLDEEHEF